MDGTINNIKEPIDKITKSGKTVLVYLDMIKGVTKDRHGIEYLANHFKVDGIITNKQHLIKYTQERGLLAGLHIFLIDSISLDNSLLLVKETSADFIELMPGVMPETTAKFINETNIPVIASGMIDSFDLVKANIGAGAVGISTSKSYLWEF